MSLLTVLTYTFGAETPMSVSTLVSLPVQAEWVDTGPNAPLLTTLNGTELYSFDQLLGQSLSIFLKVPQSFPAGKQIFMFINYFSPSATNAVQFIANTYLIRNGVDAVDSVANLYTSTNALQANPIVANLNQMAALDLTTTAGKINNLLVNPGDMLFVNLSRSVSDTDTASVSLVPNATEVAYQS